MDEVAKYNEIIVGYGLKLTEQDLQYLATQRKLSLQWSNRIEFGEGILKELVFRFCDSPYVDQYNFVETMEQLQDVFYEYKNEFAEEIPDDELLDYMEEAFNGICQGTVEFMEDTVLEVIARRERGGE